MPIFFVAKNTNNFVVATLLQARVDATRRYSGTCRFATATEALLGVSYR
ncbi:hypothetical protein J3369_13625 [Alteromonas sp. NFXS44]